MFFKSKVFVACLAISALTAFGIGCGDDDDNGGSGGQFTSVDGSAELGSLSAEDAKTLCQDTESYYESKTPANIDEKQCDFSGLIGASIAFSMSGDLEAAKVSCAEARTECLESEDEPTDETTDSCTNPEFAETCTVTVDDYVACQKANATASIEMFNSIPACDDLTEGDLTMESTAPAECETFNELCG